MPMCNIKNAAVIYTSLNSLPQNIRVLCLLLRLAEYFYFSAEFQAEHVLVSFLNCAVAYRTYQGINYS